jgi:5-methylcytosine-specific restriction endonuclease McrA
MATAVRSTELPQDATQHCLRELPYRAIVFVRSHGQVPLYQVAGSAAGPRGARKALQMAFDLHGGACFYCGHSLTQEDLTIDHAEPVSRGGNDHLQNLLLSCKPCNKAKAARPIEMFRPEAGREWLAALHAQIKERLDRLS